jgi:hypothetical protein
MAKEKKEYLDALNKQEVAEKVGFRFFKRKTLFRNSKAQSCNTTELRR